MELRMRQPKLFAILGVSVLCVVLPAMMWGHQEDPKTRYQANPYQGPGYRSGHGVGPTGGVSPFGPVGGFNASGVMLLSWLTLPELGPGINSGNDCWGYTSPSGREYALIGTSAGTTVVEITNPGNPQVIQFIAGPNSLWRDVKTYSTFAYSVSEGGGGIQVIDLSGVDSGTVTLVNNVVTGGTEASHNVAIDETSGFLYRCGGAGNGLRVYSLANPSTPTFVASWPDRYVHDAQIVTYTSGPNAGQQIAFCCSGLNGGSVDTGLDILDVTDKNNILTLSTTIYPLGQYSHQGWLSPDFQFFYLGDELDEGNLNLPTKTFVFDVSNLSQPVLLGDFTNNNSAIGHNMYTVGSTIFQANYRSGLRVFDASNPLSPVETAFFDTYPTDDQGQFNGLWSVFPYFPSGLVIGSDLERGLFVWQVGDPALSFDYPLGLPIRLDPSGDSLLVDITPASGQSLDPNSPTLWIDLGTGFQAFPLALVSGVRYEVNFPATSCGELVAWYLEATPSGGSPLASPRAAPAFPFETPSELASTLLLEDTMEMVTGLTVGAPGDTATTGIWTRVNPIGTAAQPEDDHTPAGTMCWITGAGTPGGTLGEDDVDGGATTLISPIYDLTNTLSPTMSYWRWYSNGAGASPGEDTFEVSISADGGLTWTLVEQVGPVGIGTTGSWIEHRFSPASLIPLTSNVRLRFVASDLFNGSIVEAGIDDVRIEDTICADCNLNGVDDSVDILTGTSADANGDGIPDECTAGCPQTFIRGDVNDDQSINLSDAVAILTYLFAGGVTPMPLERADIDADGTVAIGDVIQLLGYLFLGGPPPAPPFPNPGCP